jgi:diadenylate cyclase
MVIKIAEEVKNSIVELGNDGILVKMQLEELIEDVPEEELLIIKDYIAPSRRLTAERILNDIRGFSKGDVIDSTSIAKLLGYEQFDNYDEVAVYPRGYRILEKIPRMPATIINNLVKTFKSFQHILLADVEKLDDVEGIGEVRARTIKQSLRRMQEQFVFDNLVT